MRIEETEIREACLDLEVGESDRMVCPFCNGAHEQSLRMNRTETGIWYQCYRVKCGEKGFIPAIASSANPIKRKQFNPKYFREDLVEVPPDVMEYLHDEYELTPSEVVENQFKYCNSRNLLYMPIRDIRGYEIGGQTKDLDPIPGRLKAISYFHNDSPKCHFSWGHLSFPQASVVVVEDILSSIKVARWLPSVALLTHRMTQDVAELLSTNFDNLIIALDPDALKNAINMRSQYSLLFKGVRIIFLDKDPKDTKAMELKRQLAV